MSNFILLRTLQAEKYALTSKRFFFNALKQSKEITL